ncbi:MAG: serine hydrolase [Gemmatimonadota bacterium]|nr:MAG: serine hydrolase [Gemmatimonadota bacterium]
MNPKLRSRSLRALALLPGSLCLLATAGAVAHAQGCPAALPGAWSGALAVDELLTVRITVAERAPGRFVAEFRSRQVVEQVPVWRDGRRLRFQSAELPIAVAGMVSDDGSRIGAFVQHASHVIRVELPRQQGLAAPTWTTDWTPLGVREESVRFDLYVGDDGEGGLGGYFFFRDQRLPGLWGYGLECREGLVRLGERNLGLTFEGRLDSASNALSLMVTGLAGSAPITFERVSQQLLPSTPDAPEAPARHPTNAVYAERAPQALADGWPTAAPSEVGMSAGPIGDLVRAVVEGEMALTHSVLVARRGKLVVEEYFYGFDRDTWHDMRSASKTVTSTLIGLAVQEGHIESSRATALQFFPRYRRYANWDERKAEITVRDLLTMSSGLDADDSDPNSVAAEGRYQSQTRQPDWIRLALDAPMIADPGSQPLYGGANPLILGGILAQAVEEPVEWFAHRTLFAPLGIGHYKFLVDPTGVVYMGGGLHLRPRDMAKYGQLYLDGGVWQGRRILAEEWVRESWGKYGRLAPLDRNGHQYGYLWWHHQYQVGDRTIETVEARGMGGQYIFVVPSLELVAVITSGNYRTDRTRQPEEILRRFILPAAIGGPAAR